MLQNVLDPDFDMESPFLNLLNFLFWINANSPNIAQACFKI